MTQTAYPQPGSCQSGLSHPFPAETATGCSIKAPLELLSFPAGPLLLLLPVRRVLKRALGSLVPGDTTAKGGPLDRWGPYPARYDSSEHIPAFCRFSSEKNASAVPAVKYLQSILASSIGLLSSKGGAVRGCLF